MNGKYVAGFLVIFSLMFGAAVYWMQQYAYYVPAKFQQGSEIELTLITSGQPEAIPVEAIEGIDADSSPLRFRACFKTPLSQAMLTDTYKLYEKPTPLIAPGWFDCFDADKIGEALETGEAMAFLSKANIAPQVDRVVAVFPDGRAYAWHQLSPDAEQ